MTAQTKFDYDLLDDVGLAQLIAERDAQAVRLLTTRNNQRLFRAAFGILNDRTEAEDAVQSAYLNAFAAIKAFEGRSSLSTWLTRIVINEALGRERTARRRRAQVESSSVAFLDDYREKLMRGSCPTSPDTEMARTQIARVLESAVAALPEAFRIVFILREIEDLSVKDTADALGINPRTVKTRHFRARRRLQQELAPEVRAALQESFAFAGADCEEMTEGVLQAWCCQGSGGALVGW